MFDAIVVGSGMSGGISAGQSLLADVDQPEPAMLLVDAEVAFV